jgi:hypothetical protein
MSDMNMQLKFTIFWDIMQCSLLSVNRHYACYLLSRWFLAQLISSALKTEAICSSEMSVDFQWTTRRYIPEDGTLHNHRCENLESYMNMELFIYW